MGTKVNDYAIGDTNLTSVMDTLDRQRKGYHGVSLTEHLTDGEPEIAAGSLVEVGGALYKFDTDEGIGDAASDDPTEGTVYIRLVPNGDNITADFTNIEPTWDDSKQGWYGTGGEANYRTVASCLFLNNTFIVKDANWHKIRHNSVNRVFGEVITAEGTTISTDETAEYGGTTFILSINVLKGQTIEIINEVELKSSNASGNVRYGLFLNTSTTADSIRMWNHSTVSDIEGIGFETFVDVLNDEDVLKKIGGCRTLGITDYELRKRFTLLNVVSSGVLKFTETLYTSNASYTASMKNRKIFYRIIGDEQMLI